MKSKQMNNPVKVIGKNCKHNYITLKDYLVKNIKIHYCIISHKRCGLNSTCNCFDNQGKLCFERKDK